MATPSQLGSYQIEGLLGVGGMGEVYRARDTKLGRVVALKLLPEAFEQDPERLARFEREAKVLAALNHPNIATLHGMEEFDGKHFLIMELVEGETLADRLMHGAIPVEETLKIARQIAEALEAAHEKGIVHRDLKPANVKITPDDKVKVLDFGLAKAVEAAPANATLSNSPTLSGATQAGVILGTAAYMSPEQAKGFQVDSRSDLFSFGCVLYEMLTGRAPFHGDTVSEILAAVLIREPDFTALPADLNPRIEELLRRALEKNAKRRWQSVGDLRASLEAIAAAPRATIPTARQAIQPLWRRAIPVIATAIVFSFIGALVWQNVKRVEQKTVMRFPVTLPEGQQLSQARAQVIALSRDGTHLAYVANRQIFVRSMSEMEGRPITDPRFLAANPFFSPDGLWIGFWSTEERELKKIAITGGVSLKLCEANDVFGASWSDGAIVFSNGRQILRVSEGGGEPQILVSNNPGEGILYGPQLINDGKSLLFTLTTERGPERWDKAQTVVQSLTSSQRKVVMRDGSDARYVPTGHLVYSLGETVLAIPFDAKKEQVLGGGPVQILENVMRSPNPTFQSAATFFAFSDSGTLVYFSSTPQASGEFSLAFSDRNGKMQPIAGVQPRHYTHPRFSPDGNQLVVATDDGRDATVWIHDLKGSGPMRRLTFEGKNRFPIWTPDSRFVTFQSDRDGSQSVFRQAADGGTAERLLKGEPGLAWEPQAWSSDSKILTLLLRKAGLQELWTLSAGEAEPRVFLSAPKKVGNGPVRLAQASYSHDGKWVAYTSTELGLNDAQVFVQPNPPTGKKYQISNQGGRVPLWSPDDKQLYYLKPDTNVLFAVDITTQPTFSIGKTVQLPIAGTIQPSAPAPRNFDISRDGRFIFVVPAPSAQTNIPHLSQPQMNFVVNWFTELQQRVPVK